jgi:VanZ family protein
MGTELMVFAGAASVLCAGCLVPNRWLPPLPNDKLLHFAGFAVLSVLALRVARDHSESMLWLLGLLVGGWLIECLQALVPDRRFCWRDIAANAAGIAVVGAGAYIMTSFGVLP